jgi:hypothetical protein
MLGPKWDSFIGPEASGAVPPPLSMPEFEQVNSADADRRG